MCSLKSSFSEDIGFIFFVQIFFVTNMFCFFNINYQLTIMVFCNMDDNDFICAYHNCDGSFLLSGLLQLSLLLLFLLLKYIN